MREHHTKEVLAFLEARYPMINFKGNTVKYDPERHEFDGGEAVFYLDGDPSDPGHAINENVKRGVIRAVTHCLPWNYALYYIKDSTEEYYSCCLVWPDVEGQKELDLARARKLVAENEV